MITQSWHQPYKFVRLDVTNIWIRDWIVSVFPGKHSESQASRGHDDTRGKLIFSKVGGHVYIDRHQFNKLLEVTCSYKEE